MIGIAVVVAGGVGAVLRHLLSVRRGARGGIAWANRLGALLLGVLVGLARGGAVAPSVLVVLGTGLCGGLTTFSSLMVVGAGEDDGARWVAFEVVVGLALAVAGIAIGEFGAAIR